MTFHSLTDDERSARRLVWSIVLAIVGLAGVMMFSF